MSILWRYYNYPALKGVGLQPLKTWRKHRDTIKHLNKLSDHELEDIGLSRGDIDAMIWLQQDKENRGK